MEREAFKHVVDPQATLSRTPLGYANKSPKEVIKDFTSQNMCILIIQSSPAKLFDTMHAPKDTPLATKTARDGEHSLNDRKCAPMSFALQLTEQIGSPSLELILQERFVFVHLFPFNSSPFLYFRYEE